MAEKRAQKATKKDGDGNYEEDLDTYFVDRLRFLNQKDHTTQHLKQRFKERNGRLEAQEETGDADQATTTATRERKVGGDEEGGLAVVCVDGSPAADEALRFTLAQMPRARSLVLAHGIRVSLTASSSSSGSAHAPFGEDEETEARHQALERRYLKMCRDAGRHCMVKHFTYTTRGGFGHAVCYLADKKDAAAVVIGQRHPRPLLGASGTAVMKYCGQRPVVLVPESRASVATDRENEKPAAVGHH